MLGNSSSIKVVARLIPNNLNVQKPVKIHKRLLVWFTQKVFKYIQQKEMEEEKYRRKIWVRKR